MAKMGSKFFPFRLDPSSEGKTGSKLFPFSVNPFSEDNLVQETSHKNWKYKKNNKLYVL